MTSPTYRVFLVTAKGELTVNTFEASSLAKAAQEAIKPEYRRAWGATVLQRGTTGKRYCIADCVKLARAVA